MSYPRHPGRSAKKVRELTAPSLGIVVPNAGPAAPPKRVAAPGHTAELKIDLDDRVLQQVQALLRDDYGGVILRGPPGTSKSWYAAEIAKAITNGDEGRIRFVQFHPSWQYEDFVEGYVPRRDGGGFKLRKKHLLRVCESAQKTRLPHVLVIDEISRVDPARVFGEALTYIETSNRGSSFRLPSGNSAEIPHNVIIIGTMNEFDRGVAQIEAALERRLGYVAMEPSADILQLILAKNGVEPVLQNAVIAFFYRLQSNPNKYCRIGHTYFTRVRDLGSLRRLWDHQLRFLFERAFPAGDDEGMAKIERDWMRMMDDLSTGAPAAD